MSATGSLSDCFSDNGNSSLSDGDSAYSDVLATDYEISESYTGSV
jgi:hypothetical protein